MKNALFAALAVLGLALATGAMAPAAHAVYRMSPTRTVEPILECRSWRWQARYWLRWLQCSSPLSVVPG